MTHESMDGDGYAEKDQGRSTKSSPLPPQPVLSPTAMVRKIQIGNAAAKSRSVARVNRGVCIRGM
jgi:hypothetical protein